MPEGRPVAVRTRPGTGRFREIRHFAQIDSTNRYALEAARAGAPEGLVVLADYQTAGRGRLGRAWTAPPGASLLVSVLLRPPAPLRSRVLMAAALALGAALEDAVGLPAQLKWPNDLVVGDRKLAGILAESDSASTAVVVGIGCNLNWAEMPPELAATSCNLEVGHRIDRETVLDALLVRLDERLAELASPALLADYRARLVTLGQRVRVETGRGEITGSAVDVGDQGELLVRDDTGETVPVVAGDVHRLRPEG